MGEFIMYYFAFAIFFALNFSLWYIIPSLGLKYITKVGRKRKDKKLNTEIAAYAIVTVLYVVIYIMFYRYFSIAINDIESTSNSVKYFVSETTNTSLMVVLFFIVSILYDLYTFYLAKKTFRLNKPNLGYIFCSLTGFFNILTYWFSNTILKLNMYSFSASRYIINSLMKADYEILLFLFPALVFINFALSFIEEK